ncbi:amidase [Chitinasiproducens palmae]|uniref:Asp-tRNAAsn/Glu-tRNAGln amidotransferase A subunit n=1 Tax=Chitinasiproducens palmae TaxID=1770053 RepID=A0A1H2PUE4_9BURK|nr:amidase [Chitinasiproducens palmae]SDV50790.1 Asp-tRNAAsn/Glu-tRNAGln amidotransferase A subunit [Chitinasiproducens palmae]
METHRLNATQAVSAIRDGMLSAETLMRACLDRIAERDDAVKAWLHVDPARAIAAAREQDKRARNGQPCGPLHGLPFGVKDMIDTAVLPTTYNSPIYPDHRPAKDAACVATARASGAVLLGKTDTVEFAAFGRRAATCNPHNLAHTAGGSSSGSGAAVADFQVPFTFGTQTGGSLIRPASFNGTYALKPSWSSVSTEGAKLLSTSLDTVGWYGRAVSDLALVASAFALCAEDLEEALSMHSSLRRVRVGVCRTPQWGAIEPAGAQAFEAAAQRVRDAGATVVDITLAPVFDQMMAAHDTIIVGEGQSAFRHLQLSHAHLMHPEMARRFAPANLLPPTALREAYRHAALGRAALDALFDTVDVLLAPAAPGEAPRDLQSTGSATFNSIWTLLHVPCLAVPCTTGPQGLPVGVQLIGAEREDAKLLRVAAALAPFIDAERQ